MARNPSAKPRAQIGMDDQWIEDSDLEQLLEDRDAAKNGAAAFTKLNKDAKKRILALDFAGERRIGRFIISCKPTEPRSVSFETEEGVRVGIKATDGVQAAD